MQFTQVKETCLYTTDLENTRAFYHNKLGLKIISYVEGRHVFFRVGSSVLLFFNPDTTRNEKRLPPHFASGPQHIAFEVEQKEYKPWKEKIESLGILIIHEEPWGNDLKSFYFHDPSGLVLEIVPKGIWE